MTLILHITTQKDWEKAQSMNVYKTDGLHKHGPIDCWYPAQLDRIANSLYKGRRGLVVLCIESNRVHAGVREEGNGSESHPRIFGPLNLDSVSRVLDLEPDGQGNFKLLLDSSLGR